MTRPILVTAAASLALGALLLMFTPFLREFTTLHIAGEWLALGAGLIGALASASVASSRAAVFSLVVILCLGSLIEAFVIALPALGNLVPNPVSYINMAEQQVFLGCVFAGPFMLAGGVLGVLIGAWLRKRL
ncbi:MAG: hypothetical protein HYR71_07575 [Chloroflexi bacterium]|nr:hypothetical protein [Chloroflexota bacterium]